MKALFVDGPNKGQVQTLPDDRNHHVALNRHGEDPLDRYVDDMSTIDAERFGFEQTEYVRWTLHLNIMDNPVMRMRVLANVMVSDPSVFDPKKLSHDELVSVCQPEVDIKPKHNILADFEAWFDQFIYHHAIPCRRLTQLCHEVDRGTREIEDFVSQPNDPLREGIPA